MSTRGIKKTDSAPTQMEALAQDVATRTAEEVIRRLNLENRTGITIGVIGSFPINRNCGTLLRTAGPKALSLHQIKTRPEKRL